MQNTVGRSARLHAERVLASAAAAGYACICSKQKAEMLNTLLLGCQRAGSSSTCKEDDRWQDSWRNADRGGGVQVGLQQPVGRPHRLLSALDLPHYCGLNDRAGDLHVQACHCYWYCQNIGSGGNTAS